MTDERREAEWIDRLIAAVVEEAEQACRYFGKHNQDQDAGPYRDGFTEACEILGTSDVIAEHIARHRKRILEAASSPNPPEVVQDAG